MADVLVLNKDGQPLSLVPLSTITWQDAIRLIVTDKVRVLKYYDDWEVHSPTTTMKVPSVVITGTYVKWNRAVKYSRSNIFLRDDYVCQFCGESPNIKLLSLDHVLPRSKGGKTSWYNVITACKACNSHKGNDVSVKPMKKPHKPTYWELAAKRRNRPLVIKDEYWKGFLQWDEDHLILRNPQPTT